MIKIKRMSFLLVLLLLLPMKTEAKELTKRTDLPVTSYKSKLKLWRSSKSIDGLYQRIAEDLKAQRPLIITGYYGMCM